MVTSTKAVGVSSSSHLKNLQAHMGNGQINFGAFSVSGWVEADTIHLQFTDNFQDLEIRFSWSLAPGKENDSHQHACLLPPPTGVEVMRSPVFICLCTGYLEPLSIDFEGQALGQGTVE